VEHLEDRLAPANIVPLASFNGSNGSAPIGAVVEDSSGNLFGTTFQGGTYWDGTVFEVAHNTGTITTLASFNGTNGANPYAGLVEDSSGNLFGTTQAGGTYGKGTVFEVAHNTGTITTLASFSDGSNGAWPHGALVEDSSGNLFGTTVFGNYGAGTVFEVAQGSGTITTLASFDGSNGFNPEAGLVEDSGGNLFGTAVAGGTYGAGTVFEVAQGSGTITTLASFNVSNGLNPEAGLVEDSGGNLFGTTHNGGTYGDGTVFEVAQGSGTITTLASFNGSNGAYPFAPLVEDGSGNLFGTTSGGGTYGGNGTVFEVAQGSGTITTLASFNGSNGARPYAGLVEDSGGNLFGTTPDDSATGNGTVFEVQTDTVPPTVTLQAPDVTSSNAAKQNPYNFSLAFQDDTLVDYQSVLGASVLVQPPTGPALTAQLVGIVGVNGDRFNNSTNLTAVYQITPPSGSWTAAPAGTYSIVLSGSPVTDLAGNPVPLGTVGTFNVAVGQATPVVQVSDAGGTYSGSAFLATATVNGGSSLEGVSPTLSYYSGTSTDPAQLAGLTPLSGAPTEAGSYTVLASFAGSADYSSGQALANFSIGQATPTVPTPTVPSGAVYDGQPHGASAGDVTGVNNADLGAPTLTYYAGTYTLATLPSSGGSSTAPTAAGNYTVVASFAGNTDYSPASALANFSIGQATPTVAVSDAGGTYNGQPFPASATAVGVDGKTPVAGVFRYTYYAVSGGHIDQGSASPSAPAQAGSYVVVAHFQSSDPNYQDADSAEVAAPGSPGDPLGLYGDAYGYRSKAGLVLEAGKSMAAVTAIDVLDLHYFDGPGGTQVVAAPAGSPYSYLLRNMNDGVYHDVTLGVVEATSFTIAQATPTVAVSDAGGTYNGSAFPATDSVAGVNGVAASTLENVGLTLTYYQGSYSTLAALDAAVAGGLTGSSTAPTGAGSYTVVASFAGSADYSSGTALATFSIAPATPTVAVSDAGGTYNGQPFPASASVNGGRTLENVGLTLTYYAGTYTLGTLPSSGGSSTAPTAAGNYTVVASFAGSTDYSPASALANFSIGQATPTVPTPTVPSGAVYDGQPHGASAGDVTGVNNADLGAPTLTYYAGTYTLATLPSSGGSSTAPTAAGNYTVVASFAGNTDYKAASALATYSIDAVLTAGSFTPPSATEGQAFGPVTVFHFTDADPNAAASDYTAVVTLGDGNQVTLTSAGVVGTGPAGAGGQIVASGDGFDVRLSYTYAEELSNQTLSAQVSDAGGATTSASTASFSVADAALTAGALTPPQATEGQSFSNVTVFHFTDADPAATVSDYTAVVTLGDGNTVTLTSSASANGQIVAHTGDGFDVQLSYTYAEELSGKTFSVQVSDAGGATTSASSSSFSVADAALTPVPLTRPVAIEGQAFSNVTVFHFTDADPAATASDYTAVVTLGDGNTVTLTSTPSSNGQIVAHTGGGFDVQLSYTYAEELSNKTFAVTVSDRGGSSASGSTTIFSVADAPLAATATAVTPVTNTAFTGVVASFTDADPNGTAGDYTATITWGDGQTSAGTIAANGAGGFTVSGTKTYAADGIYAITVTIADVGGSTATASSTAYVGGLAKHLSVTAATAESAGTPFPVTVAALDASGNPAYNYTGTVQFTSTDANAVLPANYTFSAGDLGTHVFNVTLETAGTHSVTATDTVTSTLTGKQTGIVVSPGAVSQLQVVTSVSTVTAGKTLTVTVTAQDAYGNTVTNYQGTVHFTSTDPQAGLPADYTFIPTTDNGKHKFSVTLKTAGSQTVTVSDTSNQAVKGTSGAVTVSPAAATHFMLSAPVSVSRGVAFYFTLTALDAYGNVATGYVGTVQFTSSDGRAVLPVNYTFKASDAGVATFQAILNTVGVQSLTATDTKTKTITGTDASIQVS
jgi:uncharacterized repeat protein (TIGR03803 family)